LSRQTFLLSEFVESHATSFTLPRLERKALLHGHCHHKSIMKMTAEESILRRIGVDFLSPASGCCGMAGSFGFEHDKYDLSMAIGELELLPAVRRAPSDWLIIADGFSCREQIARGSDRHALHVAEVLQMATNAAVAKERVNGSPLGDYPEFREIQPPHGEIRRSMKRADLGRGALAAGAMLFQSLP
jgi:Fe-S oxidoreductase